MMKNKKSDIYQKINPFKKILSNKNKQSLDKNKRRIEKIYAFKRLFS
ncbi:hypothetical protein [Rodentibacter caecimuris]|nr:hypothetical protein [Rodentibacter heylii]